MYQARSDAHLKIPYGDTLMIEADISDVDLGFEFDVSAQLRDSSGEWLTDFNIERGVSQNTLFISTDVVPVGIHYMDIMFSTAEGYFFHSEPFIVEITDSVTRFPFTDENGRNGYGY